MLTALDSKITNINESAAVPFSAGQQIQIFNKVFLIQTIYYALRVWLH